MGKCLHLNPICSGFGPLERLCGALEDARSDAGFLMSSFFLSKCWKWTSSLLDVTGTFVGDTFVD